VSHTKSFLNFHIYVRNFTNVIKKKNWLIQY
jgi:hypothetical protein